MPKLKTNKAVVLAGVASLYVLMLWMVPRTPDSVVLLLQQITGHAVVFVAQLLGLTAHYNMGTQLFGVAGFDMILAAECVALNYFAILWLSIALMPHQSVRRKLLGCFCCTATLFGANVLRLILLGMVGQNFPHQFEFVHDFVWQVVFAVLTFVLCFSWTKNVKSGGRLRSPLIIYSLLSASGFAILMNVGKIYYLTALSWFSDKILLLLHTDIPLANRWWAITHKHFVTIRLQGERIFYKMPGGQDFTVNFWQDLLGMALFLGLCAGGLIMTVRRYEMNLIKSRLLIGIVGGALLLLLVQVGSLVSLGYLLMSHHDTSLAKNFLWLMRGLSAILPVLLWWLIWRKQESESVLSEGVVSLASQKMAV